MITLVARSKLKGRNDKLPRLLVTGCSGSLGRMMDSVFKTVFDYDLVGIDRDPRIQRNYPWSEPVLGCTYHQMDYIYQDQEFTSLLKNDPLIEKVAHFAEISRDEANLDYQLAKKYNVEGTKQLIQRLKENCDLNKMHLFFRSDMSVYGDRTSNPSIKVTDKPNPNPMDYYAQTKLEAENIIKESGLRYTIFRFAPVCDHQNWWVDLHPSFFYFGLDQKIEWITARDGAKAVKQAMYKSEQIDKMTFNIGGGAKLIMRHRDFMKEIMKARGVMYKDAIDLDPYAFANINLYGGYYEDSDYSNSMLGYRMQPIDTAYLKQMYRFPFPMRWINKLLPAKYTAESQYEDYSHVYQAYKDKEADLLKSCFDESKMLPREKVIENLEYERAVEQDEKELKERQLRNAQKKARDDFIEAMKQAEIREAIEKKWRERRQELIAKGENPDQINLDNIEALEAEDKLREEQNGIKKEGEEGDENGEKKEELTEEEKIRQQEFEEEEREKEKRTFGF